jgi:isoleucyl-tRNA synthetase
MTKFREYKQLNLVQVAHEVNECWLKNNTFAQSIQNRKDSPTFTFYEGPPSANGEPGIHHVLSRTLKDLFCRYKTLQGYQVERRSGWDTHGLPVELEVEKKLGITKEEIGQRVSIEDYNKACRQAVLRYKAQWETMTEKLGYWLDKEHPYTTFDSTYIESVWQLLQQLYNKGLLYKGYSIQPYSPAAGTGLSSHELNQPGCYRTVKDVAIVGQFKVSNTVNDYLLAWTTTPWTLPANSALAVGEAITYVKIRTYNPYTFQPIQVILAEQAVARYFPTVPTGYTLDDYKPGMMPIPWEIIDHYSGKELTGLTYEQLLPYVKPLGPAFRVVVGDFVTTDEGTGIVHIAPTFGADDMRLAQRYQIPSITVQRGEKAWPIVDRQGRFMQEITDWAGQYVKEAYEPAGNLTREDYKPVDLQIAIKLKQENKAFHVAKYEHTYPHCWRTDKPILYYPLDAWFIKTTAYRDRLVALNKTIHWKPAATGTGRFENWLENLVDWNLSRDRFWGTPLPIWRTEDGQEEICIGSFEMLRQEVNKAVVVGFMDGPLPADFDAHRPYVDRIILASKTGKKMHRVSDVIDVWFDSGAMPYAQWHYPFENQETFQQHFPADFIAEGVDQTRGWFFTLHAIAGMVMDQVAFKAVVSNGLILDKDGNKMSKRLGNSIDAIQLIEQQGADALRWYMLTAANPWENLKFDLQGPAEAARKFFITLYNSYHFFALYANLDTFNRDIAPVPLPKRPVIDRWILSRLHTLVQYVSQELDDYEPTKACRAIQDFVVEDLSNWYIRLNRKRFWKSEQGDDKLAAYQTLYTCLTTVAQLASPMAPFYTERLYQDLQALEPGKGPLSVHLTNWPQVGTQYIDVNLEAQMHKAQRIVSLVHALRKKHHIKVRQPLLRLIIPADFQAEIAAIVDLIMTETNIKEIVFMDDKSGLVSKKVKPNFKALGGRYKADMNHIAQALSRLSPSLIQTLEQQESIDLTLPHKTIQLLPSDVQIVTEDIPGWLVATEGDMTIALDLTITDELKKEGLARELVNKIQNLRKEQGLAVQDKIQLMLASQEDFVTAAIKEHQAYICYETQALSLEQVDALSTSKTLILDDYTLHIKLLPIPQQA